MNPPAICRSRLVPCDPYEEQLKTRINYKLERVSKANNLSVLSSKEWISLADDCKELDRHKWMNMQRTIKSRNHVLTVDSDILALLTGPIMKLETISAIFALVGIKMGIDEVKEDHKEHKWSE